MRAILSLLFSIGILITSASYAEERASDKCGSMALEAALAIAKINNARVDLKVLKIDPGSCSEEYTSVSDFRVGSNEDDIYFSYRVEIGTSSFGGNPCEVITVDTPKP